MSLGSEILADFIHLIFGFFIFIVMLRFILQLVRADFYNPVSQAIVKVTAPVLNPLRRIVPGLWGIDLASVTLMLLLKILEWGLVLLIVGGQASMGIIAILAIAQLIQLAIYIFVGAILISIIISWINPHAAHTNPIALLAYGISEPLMRPARRLIPPLGGIDFSPILVIFVLMTLLKILNRLTGI